MTSLTDSLRVSFEADDEACKNVVDMVNYLNAHISNSSNLCNMYKINDCDQLIYKVRTFNVIGQHGKCNLLLTWKPVEFYTHIYLLLTVITMMYTLAKEFVESPHHVISIKNDRVLHRLNIHLIMQEGRTNADLNNLLSFIKDKYVDNRAFNNTDISIVDDEVVLSYKTITLKRLIEIVMDIVSSCWKIYGYVYFKFTDDNEDGNVT